MRLAFIFFLIIQSGLANALIKGDCRFENQWRNINFVSNNTEAVDQAGDEIFGELKDSQSSLVATVKKLGFGSSKGKVALEILHDGQTYIYRLPEEAFRSGVPFNAFIINSHTSNASEDRLSCAVQMVHGVPEN